MSSVFIFVFLIVDFKTCELKSEQISMLQEGKAVEEFAVVEILGKWWKSWPHLTHCHVGLLQLDQGRQCASLCEPWLQASEASSNILHSCCLSVFILIVFLNYSIVDLQYYVCFTSTEKWFSYTCICAHTHIYSFSLQIITKRSCVIQ